MGDISELRGLVTAGTFITISVILVGLVPSQFYVMEDEKRQIEVADYWEVLDLLHFNETWPFTLYGWGGPVSTGKVDMGGYTFEQYWWEGNVSTFIMRWDKSLIIFWRIMEDGVFYHDEMELGTRLTSERLNYDYANGGLEELEYTVIFPDVTQMKMIFTFNTTTYPSPGVAWGNSELYGLWGMNFDQTQSTFNAWDIIAMLLFFNLPNVHWVINLILKIPIAISIIYISFILLLRAIGAFFGGGA